MGDLEISPRFGLVGREVIGEKISVCCFFQWRRFVDPHEDRKPGGFDLFLLFLYQQGFLFKVSKVLAWDLGEQANIFQISKEV